MAKEYMINNCLYCEKPLENQQKFYCSRSCKMRHNNPNPKKQKIRKICPTCKKIFYVYPSLIRIKFCSFKCRKHTKETKEKISIKKRSYYKNNPHPKGMLGKTAWNKGVKGIHFSSQSEFKPGEKHIFWKGGISKEPYPFEFTKELKSYIKHLYLCQCQICETPKNLLVHHIDYDKRSTNLNNLIPLCRNCHSKTNYNRKYWIKYLINKVIFNENVPPNNIAFSLPAKVI